MTSAPLRQRIVKGKTITHRVFFDSLQQCASWAGDTTEPRWSATASQETGDYREAFTGTKTFEDALDLVNRGWKEGRSKMIKNVESLALKTELNIAPSFLYDVAGSHPEVPLAIAGDPCCMWSENPLQNGYAPVLRFVIAINASSVWSGDDLMRWGSVILSVVDAIESQGRCSIELSCGFSSVSGDDKRGLEYITRIKNAGSHIDFDVMAFALAHPAMFRRIGFGCFERVTEDSMENHMGMCYGRSCLMSEEALQGAYYIPGVDESGIDHHLISNSAYQKELFEAIMRGFRRLIDGKPFHYAGRRW